MRYMDRVIKTPVECFDTKFVCWSSIVENFAMRNVVRQYGYAVSMDA